MEKRSSLRAAGQSSCRQPVKVIVVGYRLGNAGGCFPDELEVAQSRIVGDRAFLEARLVQAAGVLEHPIDEAEHVIDVEPPLTSRGRLRHAPPPARHAVAAPRAAP